MTKLIIFWKFNEKNIQKFPIKRRIKNNFPRFLQDLKPQNSKKLKLRFHSKKTWS